MTRIIIPPEAMEQDGGRGKTGTSATGELEDDRSSWATINHGEDEVITPSNKQSLDDAGDAAGDNVSVQGTSFGGNESTTAISKGSTKKENKGQSVELLPHDNGDNVPSVMVEYPTPAPDLPSNTADVNNNDGNDANANNKKKKYNDDVVDEEEDYEVDSDEDDDDENVEEEQEVEDPEMTFEEKKEMHEAVKQGDIDLLEDCLDKPNADINMLWFKENLLMTSIRHEQTEMAEFLLDNGIDHTYSTSIVGMKDTPRGKFLERYELSCRQMAYDKELDDIVELIDFLQGNLFPFVRPRPRTQRMRRPKPPTPIPLDSDEENSDAGSDITGLSGRRSGSESDVETSEANSSMKNSERRMKKKHKKSRKRKDEDTVDADNLDETDEKETDKTTGTGSGLDVDSGHHSPWGNKLKKAALKEHDKLSEGDEHGLSSHGEPSPRRETGQKDLDDSKSPKELAAPSEKSAVGTELGSHTMDEGYGSISLVSKSPSLPPPSTPIWAKAPTNRIRITRSALALRQMNVAKSSEALGNVFDRPLRWRKLSTVGSYARESRYWHVNLDNSNKSVSSEDHSVEEITELRLTNNSSSSNSNKLSVTSASSSSTKSSLPNAFTETAAALNPVKSTLETTQATISATTAPTPASVSQVPGANLKTSNTKPGEARPPLPVASYMRPTKSTMTKRRLNPQFVNSYQALDFQSRPNASREPPSKQSNTSRPSTDASRVSTIDSASKPLLGSPVWAERVPFAPKTNNIHQKRNHCAISFRN